MEENKSQFIIVGLGNPGRAFRETRHNIGFMLVSRLAERLEVEFSRMESKSLVTKGDYKLIYYPAIEKTLLFNLKKDPKEIKNLAEKKKYQQKIVSLRAELIALQKEIGLDEQL